MMAMVYRPTVSGDGRVVETAQWNALAKRFRGDGVLTDDYGATSLQVSADGSGMQVTVAAGEALMLGGLWTSDADEPVVIEAADGTYDRIDVVVARFDRVTETASLAVLKGTPAATPAAETPTQNAAVWELALAEVYVAAGVTSIGASDVTDRREMSAVIPHVHPPADIMPQGSGSGLDADTVRGHAPPASGDAAADELVLGNDSRLGGGETYITGTGECVRFASGLQICWVYPVYVVNGSSATWTYPAAFSGSPTVLTTGYRATMVLYSDPPGTTSVAIYNSSTTARNAGIIAIGKWT